MKTVTLPSGKVLQVHPAPFEESKALYQAMLEELKGIPLNLSGDITSLMKDVFCSGFSSKKIESALKACMSRSTIEGQKVTDSLFEPIECRQDYMEVCFEVALENVLPFTKSLYAKYQDILNKVSSIQK